MDLVAKAIILEIGGFIFNRTDGPTRRKSEFVGQENK
jgi:hypothetical protein